MAAQRHLTGRQAVQDVMKGMAMTIPTTVAGATDKRTIQLWQLATDVGQELAMMADYQWQILSVEYLLATVIGTASYALPADFNGFYADSSWNRTTRLPVMGSLQEFEWQMLKARNIAGTTFTALFRVMNDKVVFYDTPTSIQTIALPYNSRNWVLDADGVTRTDNLAADGDIILFDSSLFKAALKFRFYEAMQFDTTKAERTYLRALAQAKANDSPGRTLSIGRGSDYPYLGVINIPDTGYGT